jgi:beta-lactamase regulating signal transducer with metallopeptidase domain
MLGWMLYAVVVSAVLGAAAWTAVRSADMRRAPARLYWSLAIVASLVLPIAIASVSIQAPTLNKNVQPGAIAAIPLRQFTSQVVAPAAWVHRVPAGPGLDKLLVAGWIAASAVLAAGIVVSGLLLHRRKAHWTADRIAGVEVFVSDSVGPAVVGLLQPRIVVPRWIAGATAEEQALIIAHERTHLDADDARLLALAVLLMICMPWNLPLWWQLRRLRLAIEVDCDARVLRGGGDVARYGETLLMVGARHSSGLPVVAAMSEPRSNLEQRLRKMLSRPAKFAWASGAALAGVSLVLAASAAEISPPNRDPDPRPRLTVAPAILDRYVGYYDFNHLAVLGVTRRDGQLHLQFMGQVGVPSTPVANDEFTFGYSTVRFVTGPQGPATGLVLHQNGVHDQVMPRTTEAVALRFKRAVLSRIAEGGPLSDTEAAMKRLVPTMMAGRPDYSLMDPDMAELVRQRMPQYRAMLQQLGPVETVTFNNVGTGNNENYIVQHAHGVTQWTIGMAADGKIYAFRIRPWS